jgi:glycosyltransferase involved in cell wall biosynthesis
MKILALEPYYGLSHKSFIDGWIDHSRHDFTLLTLPANIWKWRMRHGAITLSDQTKKLIADGQRFDAVFCSDMLNLAEYLGLCGAELGDIPTVAYFHENQLTYPVRFESERDYQYVLTNMTTMLAADAVWFNSAYHRDDFLTALRTFLKRMPDNQSLDSIDGVQSKSSVHSPGIKTFPKRGDRAAGPMRIVWAGRWEHDKNPEDFFAAVKKLKEAGVNFRLSVVGEHFKEVPEVFGWAEKYFAEHIDHFGYQPTVADYRNVLSGGDVFVSTANHEFFGISALESISAGVYPVLPNRLAYPELIGNVTEDGQDEYLYDGTVDALAGKLITLAGRVEAGKLFNDGNAIAEAAGKFCYRNLAAKMDDAIKEFVL